MSELEPKFGFRVVRSKLRRYSKPVIEFGFQICRSEFGSELREKFEVRELGFGPLNFLYFFIEVFLSNSSSTTPRFFIYKILRSRARAARAHRNSISFVMNFSIVTLFNEKAEPAELHPLGFGVRKKVAGSEFGNSGSANSITGLT